MASFLNAALPSDDEEDDDFVPSEDESAEGGKKPIKKRKAVRGAAMGANVTHQHDDEEEDDEEPAAPTQKQVEKKAKVDDLWSKLNAGGKGPTKGGGVSLANLCKPVAATKKAAADQVGASYGRTTLLCCAPRARTRLNPRAHTYLL
jgi:hypothetical protein